MYIITCMYINYYHKVDRDKPIILTRMESCIKLLLKNVNILVKIIYYKMFFKLSYCHKHGV